jgi:ankyrin repeat protein
LWQVSLMRGRIQPKAVQQRGSAAEDGRTMRSVVFIVICLTSGCTRPNSSPHPAEESPRRAQASVPEPAAKEFGLKKDELKPTKTESKATDPVILKSLHNSFADGSDETLLKLLKDNPALVHDMDESECTALHYAARYGRVETAKWLIEQKADVNTVSYNRFTPMHVVTDAGVARLLIKGGANLKAIDAWGKTPLQNAAQMNRKDVCEAILEAGFPIDLTTALWLGKRDVAKNMIKENPAIAKRVDGGSDLWGNTTPLGIAAGQGDKEIVELLLKAGAPVNAATNRPAAGNFTALSNAVLAKQYEIAEILCKAGADCNVSAGKFYPTLLDYAMKHSEPKMVELLKKYGGKPLERN